MLSILLCLSLAATPSLQLSQDGDKPNILVIWGDDIGWSNFSV
jgi:hypothetical protein